MLLPLFVFAVLWVTSAILVCATMLTDAGWQASETSRVRAAAESALLVSVVTLLPALFVGGVELLTPMSTLRGRTLYPWADEVLAVAFVGVGGYLAYVSRTRGAADGDDATTSREGQERIWLILGGGMAGAALVAGFLFG